VICGIDPGLDGGICVLNDAGEIRRLTPMPTMKIGKKGNRRAMDLADISMFLIAFDVTKVYIEQVWTRPQDGRVGAMRLAEGAAEIRGLLFGVKVPLVQVAPQTWMKALGIKADKLPDGTRTKDANIRMARQLWPGENWLATKRSRNPHTGMVDAALIASYGQLFASISEWVVVKP
jgi:hypothetical protein